MAGHSKWKQIKHKKGAADKKRALLFSKLLRAISIAAKTEPNPHFNPRLRSAVEKARENHVPQENIERAISKASEEKNLEEVVIEAYGPEGAAIMIFAITDNKNRTISEIKHLLSEYYGKMAEQGSVQWAFSAVEDEWKPNFPQSISEEGRTQLDALLTILEAHDDVQSVITNINQ